MASSDDAAESATNNNSSKPKPSSSSQSQSPNSSEKTDQATNATAVTAQSSPQAAASMLKRKRSDSDPLDDDDDVAMETATTLENDTIGKNDGAAAAINNNDNINNEQPLVNQQQDNNNYYYNGGGDTKKEIGKRSTPRRNQHADEADKDSDDDKDDNDNETSSDDDDDNNNSDNDKKPPAKCNTSILIHGAGEGIDCVDFPLSNIKHHLICSLCNGYFRDPYTVADCLHSFCRSCLILTFRLGHRRCPTCNTSLEPDPFREVLADRTLQEVVDKIFPWMRTKEDEDEREFYARRGIQLKPEYAEESPSSLSSPGGGGINKSASGSKGGGSGKMTMTSKGGGGGELSAMTIISPSQASTNDMLDLALEPDESAPDMQRMPPLRNSSLRTSGRLKIVSVKKYLLQRLGLSDAPASIEVLCDGDPIGEELSLTFIIRTRWFNPNRVLTLNYRLAKEYTSNRGEIPSGDVSLFI